MTEEKKQRKSRKKIFIALSIAVVILIAATCLFLLTRPAEVASEKPSFQTVLPKGRVVTDLGGWKRVSPPQSDPVFAFTDNIDGVPVIVSQQAMPASFTGNINDQVTELAKRYNAAAEIDANGVIVYIGNSAKGPQSVIFTKNNLLILIKSEKKIEDGSWAAYVKSLQ